MPNSDPKEWDPPQYLPVPERRFLVNRAETLHHIQESAYLAMGQVLLQVREKFKKDEKLDGWWQRWIEEATPLTKDQANNLIAIARGCQEDPEFVELTKAYAQSSTALIARLPPKVRSELVKTLNETKDRLSQQQLNAISSSPEVELEKAELLVQELHTNLAQITLKIATTDDPKKRNNAKSSKARTEGRLELAIQKLSEARRKVNSLEKERSTQELVVAQLQAQLRQQKVQMEEMSLDPAAKRKRAVAKTIVDASNGLDLLLQSLDKYEVDREDIGEEALRTIERKMSQVKAKLLEVRMETL
jgi:chromosome segregation ATPase